VTDGREAVAFPAEVESWVPQMNSRLWSAAARWSKCRAHQLSFFYLEARRTGRRIYPVNLL